MKKITASCVLLVGCLSYNAALATHLTWNLPFNSHQTVWHKMAAHFALNDNPYQPEVYKQIRWYASRQEYITRLTQNAEPYIYYVLQQALRRHIPAELALLPMVESNYNPFLVSHRGATGLWQMMPGTASGFGLQINWWYDGRRNIIDSTKAAFDFLTYLHDYFGNWLLAIAAYDSGAGTVQKAIRYNLRHHRPINFWALPLPRETKHYVPKLLALAAIIKEPKRYHVALYPVLNQAYFATATIHRQMGIAKIAKMANVSVATIRALNPGFRRWATMPNQSYQLLLPTAAVKILNNNRKQATTSPQLMLVHYTVKHGNTLSEIAKRFNTSTRIIKKANHLSHNMIRVGQKLTINVNHKTLIPHPYHENATIAENWLPGPRRVVHIIRPGETLGMIAHRYGVTTNAIYYWNNIGHNAKLHTGDQILIWEPRHHHYSRQDIYRVRRGDNLTHIAKRFHVRIRDLRAINHLKTDVLHTHQQLKLPTHDDLAGRHYQAHFKNGFVVHRVKPGETLSSIAKYYRVNVKNIVRWNHLEKQKYLHIGEPIQVYITA